VGRGVLQARGGIDDVAGRERLARARVLDGDDRLARVHSCPRSEPELMALVQLHDRVEDAQPRTHRPLSIVAVGAGCAENGHDRIADELLDDPAVLLDALPRLTVVDLQHVADILGIGFVGARGRVDEVDEENGHELPLLPRSRRFLQRRTTAAAEP